MHLTADLADTPAVADNLDRLDRDGFLLVPGALDAQTVEAWKRCLARHYDAKAWDISNDVGNVAFDRLLAQEPALTRPLIGHPSVAPYLRGMLDRQCQLRSLRAHVNPGAYVQEWHMDFYDYWDQPREGRRAVQALCMNTTFYLTDNTPDTGRLTFIKDFCHKPTPDEFRQVRGYTSDRGNPFQRWCDAQEHVHLYPSAGDAVVFFSHVPHQGAKLKPDAPGSMRSNVVLHYQTNPMYPGIAFVSSGEHALQTLGYEGTFPFAGR